MNGDAPAGAAPEKEPEAVASGAPESDSATATGKWRSVAHNAKVKLSGLIDDAKGIAMEKGAEVSKKIAGAAEEGFDETFESIKRQAKEMMEKGKSTRVRLKLRERTLAEMPIAAMAAAEAASLWWFGPVRMFLGHMLGRAVLEVEFVSSADPYVSEARGHFLDGEIDKAMSAIDRAIEEDHTCGAAHMLRGTLLKIKGDKEGARAAFQRAEECDARGEMGARAKKAAAGVA
jgi:hypothetical protein